MVRLALKILQQVLQNFQSVFDHFVTLCINALECIPLTHLMTLISTIPSGFQGV